MAVDPVKLAALHAILDAGNKPAVCEILEVEWDADDAGETRYYADAAYDELVPYFNSMPLRPVEPRLLSAFNSYDLNPDLRTQEVGFEFDDIDKEITGRFQDFGSGVRCEIHLYYPEVDLLVESLWFGQLQAPDMFGWKTVKAKATNGFFSREQVIPHRQKPKTCPATYGGHLPTAEAIRTNLCPADVHIGGSIGNGDLDCHRMNVAICNTKLGTTDGKYFGGIVLEASATISDGRSGYLAKSRGNRTALEEPHRVIFGTKIIREMDVWLSRREVNQGNPTAGWFASVIGACEGPVKDIRNIKVNGTVIGQQHLSIRKGYRGQAKVANYNAGGEISNFSKTAHFSNRFQCDPTTITPQSLESEATIDGFTDVAVFASTEAGNGIVGSYYADQTFTNLVGVRIDSNVNFETSVHAPMSGIGDYSADTEFCVRWEGFITAEYSETYTFELEHDDGVKLWIDGDVVIDQLAVNGTHTGTHAMTADTPVTIRIDFLQSNVAAPNPWKCILRWSSATVTPKVVIPNSALTHNGASGSARQWTNDRVWCLGELMTNQTFGMRYPSSRIDVQSWVESSHWGLQNVDFTNTYIDGEVITFDHRRTTFDAIVEVRPAQEVLTDICRSGGMCVPFQTDGKFHLRPLRVATADELTNAKVFTDRGENVNIEFNDEPAISVSWTPDDKIVNEIKVSFEDAADGHREFPFPVDDPHQKLRAGRALGAGYRKTVPKSLTAFGIVNQGEAVKFGYRILRFGEFDEGGIQNNLRVTFKTVLERALGLLRYDIIKVESDLLDGFTVGTDDGVNDWTETPEYFRVLRMRKLKEGQVEITAQAYNHTAYTAFETVTDPPETPVPPSPGPTTPSPGPGPAPQPCLPTVGTITFDPETGMLNIPVPPC